MFLIFIELSPFNRIADEPGGSQTTYAVRNTTDGVCMCKGVGACQLDIRKIRKAMSFINVN